jgi:hypothetical protein
MKNLVKLAYFNSIMEAELAKNKLDQEDIKVLIEKQGIHFPGDYGDNMGATILVVENDLEKAKDVLDI